MQSSWLVSLACDSGLGLLLGAVSVNFSCQQQLTCASFLRQPLTFYCANCQHNFQLPSSFLSLNLGGLDSTVKKVNKLQLASASLVNHYLLPLDIL